MIPSIVKRSAAGLLGIGLCAISPFDAQSQFPPEFGLSDIFIVNEQLESFPFTAEANLALNTEESEMLLTFYDTGNAAPDPITGETNQWALLGVFVNSESFEILGDPFVIMGNPNGGFETHEIDYNPVTDQYIAIGKADNRGTNGVGVPIISVINPSSVSDPRIAASFVIDEDASLSYDDTSVAVDTNRGGYLVVAEKDIDIEGNGGAKETIVGYLFDSENNQLNEEPVDLDGFNVTNEGDVDDPDVQYLPENDLYFALFNTDGPQTNATAGRVILPDLNDEGLLELGEQTSLQTEMEGFDNPSHPSAIENPFTGEFVGAYDVGNSDQGGYLTYFEVGGAPEYALTETQEDTPYVVSPAVEGDNSTLVNQRHPQMALDENSGVFIVSYNVNGGFVKDSLGFGGMLFNLLGPDGQVLPPNENNGNLIPELSPSVYTATPEEPGVVDNSANNHNVKYDPNSDSFIIIYTTTDEFTNVVRVTVESDHTPASVSDWMLR